MLQNHLQEMEEEAKLKREEISTAGGAGDKKPPTSKDAKKDAKAAPAKAAAKPKNTIAVE